MRLPLLAALLFAALAPAQQTDAIRLARIRAHMAENLRQLPNYTCTQTIERSTRRAKSRRYELSDTLRLEVALVNGKELFAWPGSGKFDDRPLSDIVGSGTSGNGNFALHARAVFLSGAPRFFYVGEVETEERRVYRYDYFVPRLQSGFQLKVGEAEGIAGYGGTFDAEASTLDVVAFDVIANDIPPHVPLTAAVTRMRYRRMKIGEGNFLLPEGSELALVDLSGTESRNVVHLSGCKQYGTESVISFAEPPPEAEVPAIAPPAAAAAPVQVGELPIGLQLEMKLSTPLEFPGSAIGDLVEGEVVSDARRKGVVMIPKGSRLRARVLRYSAVPGARMPTTAVSIRLLEIDLPGGRAEVQGAVDRLMPSAPGGARVSVDNGGIIYISSGSRHALARGTRIWWRLEPKTERGRP